MTTTSPPESPAGAEAPALRRRLAWVALAACAPYLGLKALWIAGFDVGLADAGSLNRGAWLFANAATFVVDGVAALIAYALTRPRHRPDGRSWPILPPLWIASGLLGAIMLVVPLSLAATLVGGAPNPFGDDDFLHGWVYAVVYGGFVVEGVVLLGAFRLYADERWGAFLRHRVRDLPAVTPARFPLRTAAATAVVLTVFAGAMRLAWAGGVRLGMTDTWAENRTAPTRALDLVLGVLLLAGAAGVAVLAFRAAGHRTRVRLPLTVAWFGTGAAAGWGGLMGVTSLFTPMDSDAGARMSVLLRAVYTAEMLSGALVFAAGWVFLSAGAAHTRPVRAAAAGTTAAPAGTRTAVPVPHAGAGAHSGARPGVLATVRTTGRASVPAPEPAPPAP